MKTGPDKSKDLIPLFYHPVYESYDFGEAHPFRGDRFSWFIRTLEEKYPKTRALFGMIEPDSASDADILKVHSGGYYSELKELEKRSGYLTIDTRVLPGSVEAARMICGGSVAAARAAMESGLAVSLGGLHHAGPDYGGGFCLLNDVAIAAASLLEEGLERVVIMDTDAHQGNGTMDIFLEEPRVLFISMHQDPCTLFPGVGFAEEIGVGDGKGFTVNIPLPPLSDIAIYRKALAEVVFPLVRKFHPEMIIRNGGGDPLRTDTLTNLGLDAEGLSEMTRSISNLAVELKSPVTELFLSGYGPYVTEGWFCILRGIVDEPMAIDIPSAGPAISDDRAAYNMGMINRTISDLKSYLEPYWGSF